MSRNQNLMYLVPKQSITDKTIVLDIDETLVHTEEEIKELEEMKVLSYPTLAGETYFLTLDNGDTRMWGTKRPHLDEFLLFCFTYFDNVCIWSAGQYDYVHAIVNKLFAGFRLPDIIMTFDDCVQSNDGDWVKPLEKFYKHPKAKGKIFPESTFIVDDKPYSFENNKDNGILIPPYSPENINELREEENNLNRLRGWFIQPQVRFEKDVRTLNKNDIFTQTLDDYQQDLQNIYNL